MRSYEFRFLREDGALSLYYAAQCASAEQAKQTARDMIPAECVRYEIWSDSQRIAETPAVRPAA